MEALFSIYLPSGTVLRAPRRCTSTCATQTSRILAASAMEFTGHDPTITLPLRTPPIYSKHENWNPLCSLSPRPPPIAAHFKRSLRNWPVQPYLGVIFATRPVPDWKLMLFISHPMPVVNLVRDEQMEILTRHPGKRNTEFEQVLESTFTAPCPRGR